MTPYVNFQKFVIEWLFRIKPTHEKFLYELLQAFRQPKLNLEVVVNEWRDRIYDAGLVIPYDETWDITLAFHQIILEQLDIVKGQLSIRNILGFPLQGYGTTMSAAEWQTTRGNGQNWLRTLRYSQPRALKVGDMLVTGEKIISPPREGGNGQVLIHLSGGEQGDWIGVPSRIPLALFTSDEVLDVL